MLSLFTVVQGNIHGLVGNMSFCTPASIPMREIHRFDHLIFPNARRVLQRILQDSDLALTGVVRLQQLDHLGSRIAFHWANSSPFRCDASKNYARNCIGAFVSYRAEGHLHAADGICFYLSIPEKHNLICRVYYKGRTYGKYLRKLL
jgi:hypothetical protein